MNIGIVGTGGIVERCLATLGEIAGVRCGAIWARPKSLEKAERLAKAHGIANVYTDYRELLANSAVEFIYIGIVNSAHYEYARQALEAGKHVICEKPLTSHVRETQELARIAMAKKLFFFEAITLIHSPNYRVMKELLPRIGQVRIAQINYFQYSSRYDSYLAGQVLPAFDPELAGGALYDINIYNFHVAVGLFGKPRRVRYAANIGFNGIDTSGIALLEYDGFIVSCGGAKDSESQSGVNIQGEKGHICLNSAPNAGAAVEIVVGKAAEQHAEQYDEEKHENRMTDEFVAFQQMYQAGDLKQCYAYLAHSITVMEVITAARQDAGIVFPADAQFTGATF